VRFDKRGLVFKDVVVNDKNEIQLLFLMSFNAFG
jgi:hypothetical protein